MIPTEVHRLITCGDIHVTIVNGLIVIKARSQDIDQEQEVLDCLKEYQIIDQANNKKVVGFIWIGTSHLDWIKHPDSALVGAAAWTNPERQSGIHVSICFEKEIKDGWNIEGIAALPEALIFRDKHGRDEILAIGNTEVVAVRRTGTGTSDGTIFTRVARLVGRPGFRPAHIIAETLARYPGAVLPVEIGSIYHDWAKHHNFQSPRRRTDEDGDYPKGLQGEHWLIDGQTSRGVPHVGTGSRFCTPPGSAGVLRSVRSSIGADFKLDRLSVMREFVFPSDGFGHPKSPFIMINGGLAGFKGSMHTGGEEKEWRFFQNMDHYHEAIKTYMEACGQSSEETRMPNEYPRRVFTLPEPEEREMVTMYNLSPGPPESATMGILVAVMNDDEEAEGPISRNPDVIDINEESDEEDDDATMTADEGDDNMDEYQEDEEDVTYREEDFIIPVAVVRPLGVENIAEERPVTPVFRDDNGIPFIDEEGIDEAIPETQEDLANE